MMRLDRFVAETCGLTRSQAGKTIRAGEVAVQGVPVRKPDLKIDETRETVTVSGQRCEYRRFRYYLLDKPTGVITATNDRKQETVLDLFPREIRLQEIRPVGRLDKDTSGLLLLTNDGEFAHRVISPKSGIEKVYYARVDGVLSAQDSERFRDGLVLEDGTHCLPAGLELTAADECLVTVREGKYHQVRRMLAAVEKPVLTLRRLSVGPLGLDPALREGQYRELTDNELCIMFKALHMENLSKKEA